VAVFKVVFRNGHSRKIEGTSISSSDEWLAVLADRATVALLPREQVHSVIEESADKGEERPG
jgi:hypothetical protein